MENLRLLEAARPEGALYAQALRQRLAVRDPAGSNLSLEEARLWLLHAAIRFDALPDLTGVDPITETLLRTHLSVAHIVARLAARNPRAYALADVQRYLARQETIAQAHDLAGWLIEIWLARALIDRLEGSAESALGRLQLALGAAAPRGYVQLFLDEADLLRPLLEEAEPLLTDGEVLVFARRLLAAMPRATARSANSLVDADQLSDRELDVLRLLAGGQSYKEIGERLFLSLNTVQFHIKSIYRKLAVNKRMQAIDRARALMLI
jgi:LuxR family maltose regulon positive regulatory protein